MRKEWVRVFTVVAVLVLAATVPGVAAGPGEAQGIPVARLFPDARFDPSVPSIKGTFGIEPGERPLRPEELVRYFRMLADASPRASLKTYAHTHEGRPLVVLAIADAETVARLDEFRAEHGRLVDPRTGPVPEDAASLAGARAVAWLAYGIHGDELSSSDAAAALAYRLVAGEDDWTARVRRELVVLMDPSENPDGRARFLAQTTAFAHAVPNPDTDDLSHATVWPWGRGNHYLFDLNRDWFSMVQPESARSAEIASWNPQLMVDSHEMGSDDTYLFSPARHPFNPHLPANTMDWAGRFAADQARALDRRGYGYYSGEWNEEFFPGYGSSWASYLGAVGILYEMASTSGTLVHQRAGTVRTFAQAVEHQATSSVANLDTLLRNRPRILDDFVASRREEVRKGKTGPTRAWLLPPGRYPERTDHLAHLLGRQGVEVERATRAVKVTGLHDIRTGVASDAELPEGTWRVRLDQPAAALARVVLDPHVPMDAEFLREEREYLERGKGSRLYETTAWSLPLLYGIEAYWTEAIPEGSWEPAGKETAPRAGEFVSPLEEDAPGLFGYLFEGTSDASVAALADLLSRGIAVRVAGKPFRAAGSGYQPGTILVKREGNPENLPAVLKDVAARHVVRIRAVTTARAEKGPDLGGHHFHPLVAPRVGVWTGWPVAPSSYGGIWHFLDREVGLRFSGLELGRFSQVDLSRYNVLVFPPAMGGGETYRHILGKKGLERLRRWIEAGGTAIGVGGGASFLAAKPTGLTKTRLRREALDRYPPPVLGITALEAEAGGPFRATGLRVEPAEGKEHEKEGKKGRRPTAEPARSSPYDVAPVLGPGARFFARGVDLGTPVSGPPVSLAEWLKPILPPGQSSPKPEDLERADARLRRFAPHGAILRVELDGDLWPAWGLPAELSVHVRGADVLMAEPPVQVPARFAGLDTLHQGGLLWPEAAGRIARTAYATRESLGRGQVILFVDDPVFREWARGTRRLLANAILYGPGLGTRWSRPW